MLKTNLREIIRLHRFRLFVAAAFAFGFIAYSFGPVSAMRLSAALAPSMKTVTPASAVAAPALLETSSAEFADDPSSITFTVNAFCAGGNFDLKVGGTTVANIAEGSCVCGGGSVRTYTTSDPTVLALIGAPACTQYTVALNGSTYFGWARVDVNRTVSGNERICLSDTGGGDCTEADLCAANYQFVSNASYTGGDADSDADGISNCTDPDVDGDAVSNGADNCPSVSNPTQTDTDGNGVGDACQPLVVAVPWFGNETRPHVVYSGGTLILQAAASVGGNGAPVPLTSGTWDPGDGSGPQAINVSNSRILELAHVYTGAIGQPFTATVSVSDGTHTYTDTFKVEIAPNNVQTKGNMAIDHGLWNLHKNLTLIGTNQGNWTESHGYPETSTASAVQAFEINGHRPSGDPTRDPYVSNASRGLNWLLANLRSGATTSNGGDSPDGNGNGKWLGPGHRPDHESYISGQVVDAIVATGTPDAVATVGNADVMGRMLKDIVQDMIDGYAQGATSTGGWEYTFSRSYNDSSASHWWAIADLAADGWNLDSPQWLKNRNWNSAIPAWQFLNGSNSGADGRCGYTSESPIWDDGLNITPACMMMISADDKPAATTIEFKAAEGFMDRNFNSTLGNLYAMYQLTKAMRTAVDGSGNPAPIEMLNGTRNWFVQYTEQLINQQSADGHWDQTWGSPDIRGNLGTAWAIIILSPALFSIPPEAICSADPASIPTTGGTVNFSSSGTSHPDPNGTIVSYEWDFGDGGTATGASAQHTFGPHAPGVLNVTLTVTDANGLSDTATCSPPVTVVETNLPPDAESGGPYTFCMNSTLILDGSTSIDSDGSIVEYLWDWTAPINFSAPNANTATVNATAAFTALGPGVHQVGLQVKDNNGQTNAEFTTVTVKAAGDPACVTNQPPVCAATTSMTLPAPYDQRTFAPIALSGASDPDGDPLTYTATSIFQDEPRTGAFDAILSPVQVRKWRSANPFQPLAGQNGRVYHISYTATDPSGLSCTGKVLVCLPRTGGTCVDGGPIVNSVP